MRGKRNFAIVFLLVVFTACIGFRAGAQNDATPPTLVIRTPSNGETFTKNPIIVSGKATDDGAGANGIASVTVNGVRAGNDTERPAPLFSGAAGLMSR